MLGAEFLVDYRDMYLGVTGKVMGKAQHVLCLYSQVKLLIDVGVELCDKPLQVYQACLG